MDFQYFTCSCSDLSHTIRFVNYKDLDNTETEEFYIESFIEEWGLLKKLYFSTKILFDKVLSEDICWPNCFILRYLELDKFKSILQNIAHKDKCEKIEENSVEVTNEDNPISIKFYKEIFSDSKENYIVVKLHPRKGLNVWQRIKLVYRYIFNRCSVFACFLVLKSDAAKLVSLVEKCQESYDKGF